MALLNEMRRLTKGFLESYDDRAAMVAAIRDNTARELSGFRAAHGRMATDQQHRLAEHTDELRRSVTKMRKTLSKAHHRMAVDQSQRLSEHMDDLHDSVNRMRTSLTSEAKNAAAPSPKTVKIGRAHV